MQESKSIFKTVYVYDLKLKYFLLWLPINTIFNENQPP